MAIISNQRALLAVKFSSDAHAQNGRAQTTLPSETSVLRLEYDDVELSVYDQPGGLLVFAFRGSDEGADWVRNLDFDLVDGAPLGGKVHAGFLAGWRAVRANVILRAKDAARRGREIMVTGHSLGGAIATLAHASLRQENVISTCFTFGAPRVGNSTFVARYESEQMHALHYRMVLEGDPVVALPPSWLGYRHTGTEIYGVHLRSLVEKPSSFTRTWRFLRNLGNNHRAHDITAYHAVLARTCEAKRA